jgi:hypothetical protein
VACCGDPSNSYALGCVTPATCASQSIGNFEMSCGAAVDCPAGMFCCSQESSDLLVTGCAANCIMFSIPGTDPTSYTHSQLCDLGRDTSCPTGKKCQFDQYRSLDICL